MAAFSYVSYQVKHNTDLLIVECKNSNVGVRAALFETLALADSNVTRRKREYKEVSLPPPLTTDTFVIGPHL